MTNDTDDILDDLFHGCAFAAFIDQALEDSAPPDAEATRRRAYRYYEEALAEKNRGKATDQKS
jgi:hypothetical protein